MRFLPYAKQSIDDSDIFAVQEALKSELITRGPKVKEFEEKIAERCDAKWAVTFTSATTALYAAFQAAQVQAADRFLTTPNSFIATTAAGMLQGARPHFVDIEKETGNISLEKLAELLKQPLSRGRFVICPVHFAGIAVDMQKLDKLLRTPEAVIIEDAAHALGSCYPDGTKVGSCSASQMTVFSFHAIKNITTGEGGCVTTNDEALYNRLCLLRNSGIVRSPESYLYEVQELSGNYHMTEFQAALGLSQLARLDQFIEKRRRIVSWYRKYLAGCEEVTLFDEKHDDKTAYHLMCVKIDFEKIKRSRENVMQTLREKGIGTQYHYIPIYRHPAVRKVVGSLEEQYPEMERYFATALTLPLFVDLQESEVEYICRVLKDIF